MLRHDLLLQIVERVLGLGEDHDLATKPGGRIEHFRVVQDRLQFAPLGVLPGQPQTQAPDLQGPSEWTISVFNSSRFCAAVASSRTCSSVASASSPGTSSSSSGS